MGTKRKMLVEKYGYDCKNAAHLIRLLRMGVEFLKDGRLYVMREDAKQLIEIKRGEWTLEQVKAVVRQSQFALHLRAQHPGSLGPGVEPEAREDFLGRGRAAQDVPPLQHDHPEAAPGQVGGAYQAIVATPDDQDVVGGVDFGYDL